MNYFDEYGRLHDKPVTETNPIPCNNTWTYSAYFHKTGGRLNWILLNEAFRDSIHIGENGFTYLTRHPDGKHTIVPISREELLGMAYLKLLKPCHLNGWSFHKAPLPKFSLVTLMKQLWELRPTMEYFIGGTRSHPIEDYRLKWKHRNYYWQNNLDQIYRFAYSIPLQDRASMLEYWGETKSLRYFFYKAIATFDKTFRKPSNGIHWLKYGGEKRKLVMQQEFPEGHPLRE